MKVQHIVSIKAICPMDQSVKDEYRAVLHVNRLVLVEEIRGAIEQVTGQVLFQEELTQTLANSLRCEVETWGKHSEFETYVQCELDLSTMDVVDGKIAPKAKVKQESL